MLVQTSDFSMTRVTQDTMNTGSSKAFTRGDDDIIPPDPGAHAVLNHRENVLVLPAGIPTYLSQLANTATMFGISTFCLHREPLPQALESLSTLTNVVEVMDDGLHFLQSIEPLESHSFRYVFHAPSRGVNIASLLEPIRKASVEVTLQCFTLAADLGSTVVVHPGYFAWEEERAAAVSQFSASLRDLKNGARDLGVTFYLENMGNWNYFLLRYPDELGLLDGVGLALDVGHAHLNHCLAGFLAHPIAHVHIHDNDGKEDSHSPVGSGSIDFTGVLDTIDREHAVPIIEVDTLEGTTRSIAALEALERRK